MYNWESIKDVISKIAHPPKVDDNIPAPLRIESHSVGILFFWVVFFYFFNALSCDQILSWFPAKSNNSLDVQFASFRRLTDGLSLSSLAGDGTCLVSSGSRLFSCIFVLFFSPYLHFINLALETIFQLSQNSE